MNFDDFDTMRQSDEFNEYSYELYYGNLIALEEEIDRNNE